MLIPKPGLNPANASGKTAASTAEPVAAQGRTRVNICNVIQTGNTFVTLIMTVWGATAPSPESPWCAYRSVRSLGLPGPEMSAVAIRIKLISVGLCAVP
jgi:hypothetical protein